VLSHLRRSCFLHVPKTGGSSLTAALAASLGPHDFYQLPSDRAGKVPVARLLERYRAVAGHFTMAHLEPVSSSAFLFTFLREPVDRVVSLFHFYRLQQAGAHLDPRVTAVKSADAFAAFVDGLSDRLSPWSNWQTYVFSGASDCESPAVKLLPRALANLDRFDFVGVQDELTRGADVLGRLRGWSLVLPPRRINVTTERPGLAQLPGRTRSKLDELNRCDAELFERARRRWADVRASSEMVGAPTMGGWQSPDDVSQPDVAANRDIEVTGVRVDTSCGVIAVGIMSRIACEDVTVGIRISDASGVEVYGVNTRMLGRRVPLTPTAGVEIVFTLDLMLLRGEYSVAVAVHDGDDHLEKCHHWVDTAAQFSCDRSAPRPFSGMVDLNATATVRGAAR
jgi:hypothetical protein